VVNRIVAGNFSGKGRVDFIVGNLGLNTRLHASDAEPATMYVKDFDGNGVSEQIVSIDNPAVVIDRHDLLADAVAVEVFHVHRRRLGVAGVQARIQAEVADDEVDATLPAEVPRDDAIPPPLAVLEARGLQTDQLPAARIMEDGDRHPLTTTTTRSRRPSPSTSRHTASVTMPTCSRSERAARSRR